ncbi:MAG: hypothetical protein ACHRXM_15630 [Isosphaerales bacterium]
MEELYFVYATGAVIALYLLAHVARGKFDPFAPVWLFLVGFLQVYVIQALSYREWAIDVRGKELVAAANFRAFWALGWFLLVYHLGIGRRVAAALPGPPRCWSPMLVGVISPPLIIWGVFCAGFAIFGGAQVDFATISGVETLVLSFPFVMMVAAVLLIVTGRTTGSAQPLFLPAGLLVAAAYVLLWTFNGKRSHSLIGVLATVCALYISRLKRPSWPVLLTTALTGVLVVSISIGWRNNLDHERSLTGFANYLGDFKLTKVLESLNVQDDEDEVEPKTYETVEYGGFLLMMDTVPARSKYDYGESYLRTVSTLIPRIVWPNKPVFGRSQWVNAWIAGSEMERDEDFTGPAIGILGATQLNGGAIGTLIVLAFVAVLLRTAYEYFRLHADAPWVQFWWSITYYNAWFMVVNDDPLVWFYYNWELTTLPIVILMWWGSKLGAPADRRELVAHPAI